jgi:hypothetical protein
MMAAVRLLRWWLASSECCMVSEGGLQAFAVGIERGVAGMKEVCFIVDWRTSRASVTTVCVAHSTTPTAREGLREPAPGSQGRKV